jgi:hypothetical protein
MTESYTNLLGSITSDIFSDMKNPFYSTLTDHITQNVLDEAFKLSKLFMTDYAETHDYQLLARNCKTIERINTKKQRISPDIHFKVNSDFIAYRVNTNVDDIPHKLHDLKEFFKKSDGLFFLRNELFFENDSFYFLRDNSALTKYKDIVAYAYAYHPKYKYIMEFQVGHPFAAYVFTRDSYLRDHPDSKLVDLWKNNFYTNVKQKLLGQNNNDLLAELDVLYSNVPTETELLEIIKSI